MGRVSFYGKHQNQTVLSTRSQICKQVIKSVVPIVPNFTIFTTFCDTEKQENYTWQFFFFLKKNLRTIATMAICKFSLLAVAVVYYQRLEICRFLHTSRNEFRNFAKKRSYKTDTFIQVRRGSQKIANSWPPPFATFFRRNIKTIIETL